jgi:hypothetical protein
MKFLSSALSQGHPFDDGSDSTAAMAFLGIQRKPLKRTMIISIYLALSQIYLPYEISL